MVRVLPFFVAVMLFLLLTSAPASASTEAQCTALGQEDLAGLTDAPTQLFESKIVGAAGDLPPYCRVRGTTQQSIGFEMQLPVGTWNGKFLQAGCGGFCGRTMPWYCRDAISRGYACIVTDMGHRSADEAPGSHTLNGFWAYRNDSGQIDHGFRAVHTTTVIGKALTKRFYGAAPKRSYFNGCSEGGREALVAAQKYPWDFDGIIAGAPAMDMGRLFMSQIWNARKIKDSAGKPLFSQSTARLIQDAVLSKCDSNDGVIDRVIGDPRQCRFDPATLVCRNGATEKCISPEQAASLSSILSGPRTSTGNLLTAGGLSPGVNLLRLLAPGTAGRTVPESYGEEYFRYLGFYPAPGQAWSRDQFDFDTDYKRMGTADAILSVTNPDLRQFQQAGGRLILYHGWDDFLISPYFTVDYYDQVRTLMGTEKANAFSRLFMIPGMDHCALGSGAWALDFLTSLEQWVENGKPPPSITGVNPKLPADPAQAFARIGRYPVPASDVNFSRVIFPYPAATRYDDNGNVKPPR